MHDSRFTPPVRRSLTDAQLQDALTIAQADEAGILAAMNLLEEQASLREAEKLEFASWEAELLASGNPEALAAINIERQARGLELLEISRPEHSVEAPLLIEDVVAHAEALQMSSPVPAADAVGSEEEQFTAEEEQLFAPEASVVADITSSVVADVTGSVVVAEPEVEVEFAPIAAPRTFEAPVSANRPNETPVSTNRSSERQVSARRTAAAAPEPATPAMKIEPRAAAISQFWSWAALGGSVFPMGLAVLLAQLNLSFGQGVLALALGFSATGALIAVGALAGKRSGLGTLMLSRAAFGVTANAVPAILLTLVRLFVVFAIFALVPLLSTSSANGAPLAFDWTNSQLVVVAIGLVFIGLLASVLAIRGGSLLHTVQKWGSVVGFAVVVAALIAMLPSINFEQLASVEGGGWLATLGAAALVFACSGLMWVGSGADFARRLSVNQLGAKVTAWVFLATAVIPFVIGLLGFAFFKSIGDQSKLQFSQNFLIGLSGAASWSIIPVVISAIVTIVIAAAMALYSASHSLRTLSINIKPAVLHPMLSILAIAGVFFAALRLGNQDLWFNLGGYIQAVAVPVAAWAGIFACDILIRRIAYHEVSLSRSYGFYKPVNWFNLAGWVIATGIGWGLTVSTLPEFSWLGYLVGESSNFWHLSGFAIAVSLAIGLLLPAIFGIPRIKRQEAEVLSLEARRNDLKDIFGVAD